MITKSLHKGITLMFFSIFISAPSFSQIYVDIDIAGGGDGLAWSTAYNNLQTALSAASNGDVLWVAEGSYTIVGDEDTSYEIPSGVALYGGFDGTESNLADRNWETNLTILDGLNTTNSIVYFENSSSSTILDGFTIQNGDADGTNQRGQSGAGIYMDIESPGTFCDPQIRNCIIKDNYSDKGGAGMYIDGSWIGIAAPYFENCTFDNNDAFSDGGAIYQNGIWGGAVNATYMECNFINNHSVGSGAALFNHGGHGDVSSIFKKCNFENNVAEGNGGAMYSLGTSDGKANHTIVNCRFYKNKGFAAGGIYNNGGNTNGDASPTITNCTFYLNEATGIDPDSGNPAGTGGAIYNNGSNGGQSNTQIKNCIIWGNLAPYGTHVVKNVHCSPTISYCLVDAEDCDELDNGSGSAVICGTGILYELGNDPNFVDAATGDLRIADTSDGKDVGDDTGTSETDDLDGNDRFVGTVDMGAYENPLAPLPVELLFFEATAQKDEVLLEWATLSEDNHELFTIEKSNNGRHFEAIQDVNGAGFSSNMISYKELDTQPFNGNNYYRLKIISFNGEVEYSDVRIVRFSTTEEVSIYPNPVSNEINIAFSETLSESSSKYEIYSVFGQLISNGNIEMNDTNATINIANLNMPAGHYILNISTDGQQINKRFQKLK